MLSLIRRYKMESRWALVALILLSLIIVPFIAFEDSLNALSDRLIQAFSDPGTLFVVVAGLLAADVFLAIPSSVVNTWAGAALGLLPATLACWLGMTLGCVIAYQTARKLGAGAMRRFVGEQQFQRASAFNARYGLVSLAALRAVPVLAEASVFWAGLAGVGFRRFLLVTSIANAGIAFAYAFVGAYALSLNSFYLAVGLSILLPGTAILLARRAEARVVPAASAYSVAPERQQFNVDYAYPVVFTEQLFRPDNPVFAATLAEAGKVHRLSMFIDSGVLQAWPGLPEQFEDYIRGHADKLASAGKPFVVPGGESCKSDPGVLAALYEQLQAQGMDRHSFVVIVGGGAVLDAVGYAAATAHRGIRQVRVPTTVLAQNDAGIGVKNGVNLNGQKNYLGSFAPPYAVFNDAELLTTLEHRDRLAGMAEAVKVALIRDAEFFYWLEREAVALARFEAAKVHHLIERCAKLHLRQIVNGGDPFERGAARPLDFGHWAAHKLETLSGHALRHGEAVAIGIALDSRYSVAAGLLPAGLEERICRLFDRLGFELWHPCLEQKDEHGGMAFLHGLDEFREHLGGQLAISLLSGIGEEVTVNEMNTAVIGDSVAWLEHRRQHL